MNKPRIFYLAWQVPSLMSGAMLAMHRHLIQHQDFEVFVASDMEFQEPGVPSFKIKIPRLVRRLENTRFARWVRQYEMVIQTALPGSRLCRCLEEFKPDLVFTIPDNSWSWTAYLLAKRYRLPLVTNFQDWWPRCMFNYEFNVPYPWTRSILESRFRRMYRESALAFCTSPGMREFLGPHPNSHVLYPIGAPRASVQMPKPNASAGRNRRFRILYTGTPHSSYGQLVRALAHELKQYPDLELNIYGTAPDWPASEIEEMKAAGIYKGFLPFEKLAEEMQLADAFLSVMSFDENLRVMMQTSFTTKILDYCLFGKPMLIWGPDYSSIVSLTAKTGSADVVTRPDAPEVVRHLDALANDPARCRELGLKATELSRTVLDHDAIHEVFASNIRSLVSNCSVP
jgi:glycosyltransferase involved in cell wall biosynthesis